MFERRGEFHIFDGADHFFKPGQSLTRFDKFIPTFDDSLRSRRKTNGMVEVKITKDQTDFSFIDIGGRKSERKKWRTYYHLMDAVIYVVSLSEFDQYCYENEKKKRFEDSTELFESIVNDPEFRNVPILVVFNVSHLFDSTNT
jgi:GTPase SAR1 family protein